IFTRFTSAILKAACIIVVLSPCKIKKRIKWRRDFLWSPSPQLYLGCPAALDRYLAACRPCRGSQPLHSLPHRGRASRLRQVRERSHCESVFSIRSRRGCAVVASLDAALEEPARRDRRRRDIRLRLHARRTKTPRSLTATHRNSSR